MQLRIRASPKPDALSRNLPKPYTLSQVSEGPLAGRRDALTGLEYHSPEPPPATAAAECLHWVSAPQARVP